MTALHLGDRSGLADLAGYLVRLLRYDRAAVVHLRADGPVLGTFGRLPFGGGTSGVIALRTTELAEPARLDAAYSAGQLLDALSAADPAGGTAEAGQPDKTAAPGETAEAEAAATEAAAPACHEAALPPTTPPTRAIDVVLPAAVTGPPWSAMLPPRTGWAQLASLPIPGLVREVAEAVGRFRARTEALPAEERTRPALDRIAEDVWSKALPGVPGTHVPLRAAHAAASLGFLGAVDAGTEATVLSVGGWLRLDGPYGSVSVRRPGATTLFAPR
ncbi:hypothetical protein [Yinghuangia soli]|uniref:Uncharacterized protein n=1 Tax=Yinghuangia soli TaxID=2908204 RepID=A0AA41U3D1_9ACTN|nr:hypothetical protein [Yinghuangia soli]MCF2531705.1 hypothetical protein [Yinghuangia soli]